jgi:hypothetical protein
MIDFDRNRTMLTKSLNQSKLLTISPCFFIFYFFFKQDWFKIRQSSSVLKPGPARRVDSGPGRPGIWSTRSNPGETRSIFYFILTVIKRHRFWLSKIQNVED